MTIATLYTANSAYNHQRFAAKPSRQAGPVSQDRVSICSKTENKEALQRVQGLELANWAMASKARARKRIEQPPTTSLALGRAVRPKFPPGAGGRSATRQGEVLANEWVQGEGPMSEVDQIRAQIRDVQEGQHPEVLEREEYYKRVEDAEIRRFQQQEKYGERAESLRRERDLAETTYERHLATFESGFEGEERNLRGREDDARSARERLEDGFEPRLTGEVAPSGIQVAEQLEAYIEIRRKIESGGLTDGMAQNYETMLRGRARELRQHGIDVEEILSDLSSDHTSRRRPPRRGGERNQELAREWLQAVQVAEDAADFPRTQEQRDAWLSEREEERDTTVERVDAQLAEHDVEQARFRSEVHRRLQSRLDDERADLTERLERELRRVSTVPLGDLRDEIGRSEAFRGAGGQTPPLILVDDQEMRLERPYTNEQVGHIRKTADGVTEIAIESLGRSGRSVLTETSDGYTEESSFQEYQTRRDEQGNLVRGRLKSERYLERDANGQVRREETIQHDHNGSRRVAIRRDEEGRVVQRITESTSLSGVTSKTTYESVREEDGSLTTLYRDEVDGRETRSSRTNVRTENGRTVTTSRTESAGSITESTTVAEEGAPTVTDLITRNDDGSTYANQTTIYEDGAERGHSVWTSGDTPASTIETETLDGRLVHSVQITPFSTTGNVPGFGWIGSHNPQDLVERLGSREDLTEQYVTTRRAAPNGEVITSRERVLASGDGRRELRQGEGNTWEYRQKNADGTWDSQVFFQGTRDSVVTRNTREGVWNVERTRSNLDEISEDNPDLPKGASSSTHTSDSASAGQIDSLLDGHHMSAIRESDSFKSFMAETGDGPFVVVASQSSTTSTSDETTQHGSIIIEAKDGRRLIATYDPEEDTYGILHETASAHEVPQRSFVTGNERLEISREGKVETFVNGVRDLTRYAEDVISTPGKIKDLARLAPGIEGTNTFRTLDDALADGPWARRMGVGVGSLSTALTLISILSTDDDAKRHRLMGQLGTDIASTVKASNPNAWNAVTRTGSRTASVGSRAATLAHIGRYAGIAGLGINVVFAAQDFAEGEYVEGSLGLAGAGGTALALYSQATWAGPVGWGIATLATAGAISWKYNEGTKIAAFQLDD